MPTGLTFAYPALLLGTLAAGLPWLIHLMLRPRPKRVTFPAVSLLRPILVQGQRASRLRNFWLLLLRTLLITLVAMLLAGPTCRSARSDLPPSGWSAQTIVLDESLSMTYRLDDRSLLEVARGDVRSLLEAAGASRPDDRWALILSGDVTDDEAWTSDRSRLLRRLAERAAPPNARTLADALRRAAALLRESTAGLNRDRKGAGSTVHIFTDLAGHAWRDVSPGLLAEVKNVRIRVHAATRQPLANLAIQRVDGTQRVLRSSAPAGLRVTVGAFGARTSCRITAHSSGAVLARSEALEVSEPASRGFDLRLPPMSPGPHGLTLTLDPDDRLSFDQVRFAALEVGRQPAALLLVDQPTDAQSDLTTAIIRNLIDPTFLADEQRTVTLTLATARSITAGLSDRPALVVVPSGIALDAEQRDVLLGAVEHGTRLVLIPKPEPAPDWPALRPLLSDAPPQIAHDGLLTLRGEPASAWWTSGDGREELERTAVRRRLQITSPAPGAVVHARYPDGLPALLERAHGDGSVWLLTTSPHPAWSDLGTRAAALITFFDRLIGEAVGPPAAAANFTVQDQSRRPFSTLPSSGLVRVRCRTDPDRGIVWVRLADGIPDPEWPTAAPGLYEIASPSWPRGRPDTAREGQPDPRPRGDATPEASAIYAVNWPPEESDLTPIPAAQVASILGVVDLQVVAQGEQSSHLTGSPLAPLAALASPEPLLGLVLALLLLAEASFADRRRTDRPSG